MNLHSLARITPESEWRRDEPREGGKVMKNIETLGGLRRSLRRLDVHVVIGLDPPSTLAPYEDFHQLRLHYAIGRYDDATRHRLHTAHFVVYVDDRNIGSDEANASDEVVFGGAFVERVEDFGMSLRTGGRAVHYIPKEIREGRIRRGTLGERRPAGTASRIISAMLSDGVM